MLSLCAVVGSTIAQVVLNSMARHPIVKTRPLIMWEVLILLLPLQLAGAGAGRVVNQIIPSLATTLFAMVVLLFTGYKVMIKGISMYKKEEEEKLKQISAEDKGPSAEMTKRNANDGESAELVAMEEDQTDLNGDSESAKETRPAVNADIKEELPPLIIPWALLRAFALMWITYIVLSSCSRLVFDRCSLGYWLLYGFTFPPLFLTSFWGYHHLKAIQEADPDSIVAGDLVFSEVGVQPLIFAFGVGITGALIGVGGGILMTPLLLGLHVTPNVASATTSTMSFTTGLTLLIQYAAAGEFVVEVGFWNMFLGFSGGFCGRYFALWFIKKYNRQSPITFAVAIVIVLAIGMLIYGITILEDGTVASKFCG